MQQYIRNPLEVRMGVALASDKQVRKGVLDTSLPFDRENMFKVMIKIRGFVRCVQEGNMRAVSSDLHIARA